MNRVTKQETGPEIDDLVGGFDELIRRLQELKEWSKTPRNPVTDEPDPNGVRYVGVNFGGPSGHGTSLYFERPETDEELAVRTEAARKSLARYEARAKRLRESLL